MPFTYKILAMPSGSMNTAWLDEQGADNWQLVNAVPMAPLNEAGGGSVMCYFISSSS